MTTDTKPAATAEELARKKVHECLGLARVSKCDLIEPDHHTTFCDALTAALAEKQGEIAGWKFVAGANGTNCRHWTKRAESAEAALAKAQAVNLQQVEALEETLERADDEWTLVVAVSMLETLSDIRIMTKAALSSEGVAPYLILIEKIAAWKRARENDSGNEPSISVLARAECELVDAIAALHPAAVEPGEKT